MKAKYTVITDAGRRIIVSGKDAKEVRRKLGNVNILKIKRKDTK